MNTSDPFWSPDAQISRLESPFLKLPGKLHVDENFLRKHLEKAGIQASPYLGPLFFSQTPYFWLHPFSKWSGPEKWSASQYSPAARLIGLVWPVMCGIASFALITAVRQ